MKTYRCSNCHLELCDWQHMRPSFFTWCARCGENTIWQPTTLGMDRLRPPRAGARPRSPKERPL